MREHNKIFFKYAFPTVMGMLVTTLYTFVDGIFVGNFVGSNAIAAIGIVWPFLSITISVSILIATGGGALVSINFGRGKNDRAQNLFSQSVTLAFGFLVIFSLMSIIFPKEIAKMLGANDVLLKDCVVYIRSFMVFGIFFGMGIVLNTFINNDGNPFLALTGMVSGCVSNIFLDYLFVYVFKWGLFGAAFASGLGQVVSCVTLYIHFLFKMGKLRLRFSTINFADAKKILVSGVPAFINEISVPLGAIVYNLVIMRRMQETGVAVFSIVAYLITIFFCVFSGVAQGLQPPVSRFYGEKKFDVVKNLFKTGLICGTFLSVGLYFIMFAFSKEAVTLFTKEQHIINLAIPALRTYSLFSLFLSLDMIIISLFQATRTTMPATVITVSKCFCLNIIFVIALPFVFGNTGIWLAAPVGELAVLLLAVYEYKKYNKKIFE